MLLVGLPMQNNMIRLVQQLIQRRSSVQHSLGCLIDTHPGSLRRHIYQHNLAEFLASTEVEQLYCSTALIRTPAFVCSTGTLLHQSE